ncbi:hypothetical protein D3C86_1475980 [compost metagenome]
MLELIEDATRLDLSPTSEHVRLAAVAAADDDVAAGNLAEINQFFGNLGVNTEHRRQGIRHRFGHGHLRTMGVQRHRFAELRRKFLAPGTSGDQQLSSAELTTVGGADAELAADLMHLGHFRALFDPSTETSCCAGKRRGRKTRIGVPIVGGVGTALHVWAEERKTLV